MSTIEKVASLMIVQCLHRWAGEEGVHTEGSVCHASLSRSHFSNISTSTASHPECMDA